PRSASSIARRMKAASSSGWVRPATLVSEREADAEAAVPGTVRGVELRGELPESLDGAFALHPPGFGGDGGHQEGEGQVAKGGPAPGVQVGPADAEGRREIGPLEWFGAPEAEVQLPFTAVVADPDGGADTEELLAGDQASAPAGQVEPELSGVAR